MPVAVLLAIGLGSFTAEPGSISHFRASTYASSAQHECAVDGLADGGLVVVWSSRKQEDGDAGVYLQRFDRDGVPTGAETRVNLWAPSQQVTPSIGALPSGGAIVVWASFGQDGDAGAIVARRFDGEMRGADEILVNETAAGDQHDPVAATSGDGSTLLVWVSDDEINRATIRGRLVRPDGRWTPELVIADGPGQRRAPSIAAGADGAWIVTWTEQRSPGSDAIVRRARLDASGTIVAHHESLAEDAYEAAVAAVGPGYVVAWCEPCGDGHAVFAQMLDADGCPAAVPMLVGEGAAPTVAEAPEGFVVAWNTVRDGAGRIALRRYGRDAAALEPVEMPTLGLPHDQALRAACGTKRIANLGDRIAIAWSGDAGAGDASSANVTLMSPHPFDLAGRRQGIDPAAVPPAPAVGGTAAPHIPPAFDPLGADHGVREIRIDDAGVGFDAILDTGWTPPDVQIAVGPEHLVAITNGRISFLDKSGTQSFTAPIEGAGGFWGSLGASNFVFDPEVIYDPLSDRFWAVASEGNAPPGGSHSYALVAVSDNDNPNGVWFKYRFDTTPVAGSIFDSPNIGVDSSAVYVTGDGSLGNYQVLIWDKASLLAGQPPAISKSLNYVTTNQSAGLPPVTFPDSPRVVLIEHKEASSNSSVTLVAINDPLGTPSFSTAQVSVPVYTKPEDPPQKGTSVRPETFDARFWSSANRNGSIWATHHVGVSRVLVRWYQIALNGWPDSGSLPSLAQSGTIDPGGTWRTYFSAIGVDGQNNAVLTFATSSPTEYISMAVATRRATDPPGTFGPVEIVKSNNGPYTEANRWGDYAGARPDESSPGTFWANHEYAVSSNNWRTWAQQVVLPPVADLDGDGSVDGADLGVLLGAWGTTGPGDLDGNGIVDGADLGELLANWTG